MDCLLFTVFTFGFGFLLLFGLSPAGLYCGAAFLAVLTLFSANVIAPALLPHYVI